MKPIHSLLLVPLLSLVMAGFAHSQTAVPSLMNYQARVTTGAGSVIGAAPTPVNRLVHFKFWKSPTSTAPADLLYSESQTVTINNSDFSVLIGNGGTIGSEPHIFANAFNNADVHLGITVDLNDDGIGNDTEITPRQQIVSTAFAMRAKVAEGVDAGAITDTMLGANAVTANKLAAGAVTFEKMFLGSIKGGNDADANPASRGSILDGSITSFDLGDNAVTRAKLADNAVGTAEIMDANVTTAKLDTDAVTQVKMADNSVGTNEILNLNVTTAKLADNAVNSAKIADGQVALVDLVAAVQEALCPPGTIVAYGGTTAPPGWRLCNGDSLPRAGTYNALFLAISVNFGSSSSTTFNVPDFRGRFLRGVDGTTNRDPDKAGRTAMNPGGLPGNNVGSVQTDQFKAHNHALKFSFAAQGDDGDGRYVPWPSADPIADQTTGSSGGNETRPVNAYVNYIIKF
jgi:microcystin-dependent protein